MSLRTLQTNAVLSESAKLPSKHLVMSREAIFAFFFLSPFAGDFKEFIFSSFFVYIALILCDFILGPS